MVLASFGMTRKNSTFIKADGLKPVKCYGKRLYPLSRYLLSKVVQVSNEFADLVM